MRTIHSAPVLTNWSKAILATFVLLVTLGNTRIWAQAAAYTQEVFGASIPYNVLNPNLRVTTTDWYQGKLNGTVGAPNDFEWINAGANPAAGNQNYAGFPAGAGFVRYLNRTIAYPALNGAPTGDAAFIATRALDFSSHTVYNAVADTFAFDMWRDNTAGALLTVLEYVEVYVNTVPDVVGATLLSDRVNLSNKIYRSSTQAPVTGIPGWNRYQYVIPNLASFVSGTGGSSNVYIIIKAVSAGGNNIFLDNFNMPQWTAPMSIVSATLFYQENADVGKSTTDNLLLGVKITTRGSTTPFTLDASSFSLTGSTNPLVDVTNPKAYFTRGTANFATNGGAVILPNIGATGPAIAQLNFGYWGVGCINTGVPATVTLNPGSENYLWFAVDVPAGATSGNYVGGDFQMATFVRPSGTCTYWGGPGGTVSSTNLGTIPIIPQTLGQARQIDQSYAIPTYSAGCSYAGYNSNDYCSAVNMPGDNGTNLNNYDHDGNPATYCPSCLATASQPVHCIRLGCHPPDYTQFKPVNVSTYKNRIVQVTVGYGKRGAGPAYTLKAQAGEWPYSNNNIAIFVDWNKDGDFSDSYNGPGGVISENYGTHSMLNGDLNNYPVAAWPANTTWTIDVPDKLDAVTNVGGAGGPIFLGNVRMRVREVYAVTNIDPFSSSYTWGEVEDYTIQVLDNCPSPATNVCKWIGTTSDWNAPTNWCPYKPTINDMAYIGLISSPFFYPTIKENTTAVCRQLVLADNGSGSGAQLNIDATANGVLQVSDDVIIGRGAPVAGSNANINVVSNFSSLQTIPAKTIAPPGGVGLSTVTPFRNNAQQKTQIAYTVAELIGTYGWKAGDVIDQISIEVKDVFGGAGSQAFQNLRIQAYLTSTPVSYPFNPAITAPSTKIAVSAGDVNVVATWPRIIYGPTTTTISMPYGSLGCYTGCPNSGNYQTINLIPNTLIWDGVSNLVLEFCVWTSVGIAPAKSFTLYDEASGVFNVLCLNYATIPGGLITGYTIDGDKHYNAGTNAGISATVSNQRPRLDFNRHRPYSKATIVVGGDWINNNKGVRAPSIVAGSDGFRAGYSLVSFDPVTATRSTVNSPGLTAVNSWNTAIQPASLGGALADIDQDITSQLTSFNVSTVFNILEIKKASGASKSVRQNSTFASLIGAYSDTLWLTTGEFNLNRKEFTLQKPVANALVQSGASWLRSEDNSGGSAGTIESKFTWKIGAGITGTYIIPFKNTTSGTGVFNLKYNKVTAADDIGDLTIGTYGTTPSPNNMPWPYPSLPAGNPLRVMTMTTNPSPILDATPWTVDRFWYIKRSTVSALTPTVNTLTFEYDNAVEGTSLAAYLPGQMKAQRYELTGANPGWHAPYAGQGDGTVGATTVRFVNHPAEYIDNTYSIWAIVNLNLGATAPLPLSITNFSGKQVNDRVKLWWDVQSETNVAKYSIERTADQSFYELITNKAPMGPSNAVLNYEVWDNKPLKGTSYYRLASNSTDGSIKYYGPITVNFGVQGMFDITNVQAGNTTASIKVDFNYDSNLPYTYMVTDMLGNVVAKGDNHNAAAGENSIVIPVQLSQGIYVVSLINNDKTVSRKLVY
ncbi:MAG: GEVED domain-containing protein [Bacteroidia bacterium]